MKIKLSEIEIELANSIGKKDTTTQDQKNITDLKLSKDSNYYVDFEGACGELAFCKIVNCYPDLKIGLDNDYDCIYNGLKVDVKTTKYKTGKLLATLKKINSEVDVYVLMIGEFPNYEFVGWARKDDLIKPENIKDLGRGKGFVLEQSQLRTKEELLNGTK